MRSSTHNFAEECSNSLARDGSRTAKHASEVEPGFELHTVRVHTERTCSLIHGQQSQGTGTATHEDTSHRH